MAELILTTFDWVPEVPRGYVRDIRVRWALEEAGLPYRVETTPFQERDPEHFRHQPFGQVPWLTDGDLTVFESGAILLHLGERSEALLPTRPRQRSEALQWLFAALNSVESASMPWVVLVLSGLPRGTPEWKGWRAFCRVACNTWRPCWRSARGWPGASPSPTSSWRTSCASSIASTDSRTIPPAALTSPAPPPALPS